MTPLAYVRDRIWSIVIALLCVGAVAGMLQVLGVGVDAAVLVSGFVLICFVIVIGIDYFRRRHFYQEMENTVENLEHAYYAAELISRPAFLEGSLTFDALQALGNSAANEITHLHQQDKAYRDYIELWIHEIKTPIAAANLMTANLHGTDATKIKGEIARIERQVEQALFYARSTLLSQDYAIREIILAEVVREACKKNARYLIECGTTPAVHLDDSVKVFADSSWLVFILGQLVANAAKYGASSIVFTARDEASGSGAACTVLEIADNGSGIPAADVPRVFDRGFTGENGRAQGSATGMGLYLVASLCHKMSLEVALASERGSGTRVLLTFPHNRTHFDYLRA